MVAVEMKPVLRLHLPPCEHNVLTCASSSPANINFPQGRCNSRHSLHSSTNNYNSARSPSPRNRHNNQHLTNPPSIHIGQNGTYSQQPIGPCSGSSEGATGVVLWSCERRPNPKSPGLSTTTPPHHNPSVARSSPPIFQSLPLAHSRAHIQEPANKHTREINYPTDR
jgi:hypothetical protein